MGTCVTTTLRPARSADTHSGSVCRRALLKALVLSKIVNWLRGRRGTRLPLMPVSLGGAPVHNVAKAGAVRDGKQDMTSSAMAPPAMSFSKFGSCPERSISRTKDGTAPSQARTMALIGGVCEKTQVGKTDAISSSRDTAAATRL